MLSLKFSTNVNDEVIKVQCIIYKKNKQIFRSLWWEFQLMKHILHVCHSDLVTTTIYRNLKSIGNIYSSTQFYFKEILTLVAKNAASSEPVSFYTANRCYRLVPVLAEFDIRLEVWINSYLRKYIIDNWQEKILVVNEKELKFQDL